MKARAQLLIFLMIILCSVAAHAFQPYPFVAGDRNAWSTNMDYQVITRADNQAYYLDIAVSGIDPSSVMVTPQGRSLVVTLGGGQCRGCGPAVSSFGGQYQWFSSFSRQQVMLPADANLAAMRREQQPGLVRVIVPRHIPGGMPRPALPGYQR